MGLACAQAITQTIVLYKVSLSIRSHRVSAIYALSQWFSVKPGTLRFDAFELLDFALPESDPDHKEYMDIYAMGMIYQGQEPTRPESFIRNMPDCAYRHWVNHVPSGSTGVQFIDAETGELVAFSLLEIRAFKELRG